MMSLPFLNRILIDYERTCLKNYLTNVPLEIFNSDIFGFSTSSMMPEVSTFEGIQDPKSERGKSLRGCEVFPFSSLFLERE